MPSRRNSSHKHHGKRVEEDCLVYIEERLILIEDGVSLESILRSTYDEHGVPIRTLRNWYNHFLAFGEYPFESRARSKRHRRMKRKYTYSSTITSSLVRCIKDIVDEHPEFYLDEVQATICTRLSLYISISTIYRILKDKIGYTLQVCYESAAQRNENERALYRTALECLVSRADQVVFVDETHKDKHASRRRKAWGPRNSGGIALKRWFKNEVRYTMIAALDINGFIESSIDCVQRTEISSEGASGTVDASYFEGWVKNNLCPLLGDFSKGEPRSIVVMDNASTHMDGKVAQMIKDTGAYLLYTAPYSPDLNPIELGFNVYKSQLKRNETQFKFDWFGTHLVALEHVDRDICIKEFRRCGVPMSEKEYTSSEANIAAITLLFISLF